MVSQQFQEYHQNEQPPLASTHIHKNTTICDVVNPGSDWEQT
jgi:hypothetical protein